MNVYNLVFLTLSTVICSNAFSQSRTISIPMSEGKVNLINPSSVTVNYSVVCKDKTGATQINLTSQSLSTGTSTTVGTAPGSECAGTWIINSNSATLKNGMVQCQDPAMGNASVASAGSKCGANYHTCTLAEYSSNHPGTHPMGISGLLSPGVATWSYNSMGWNDVTDGIATFYPKASNMGSGVANGSSGSGLIANTSYDTISMSPNVSSVMCCPNLSAGSHCQVNINMSTTPAAGHLISPQFNGGKGF
jgi:hypothetical protein